VIVDYERDAWLAGFAAGEGCFMLVQKRQDVQRGGKIVRYDVIGVQPWFQLGLREDDRAVLDGLAKSFGGTVRHAKSARKDGANRQDRYVWVVCAKTDMRGLVAYFDRFPLRSKKARDYEVWREAVLIYCDHGARDERLLSLRQSLMEGRVFEGLRAA
jgi:hypothetical protein